MHQSSHNARNNLARRRKPPIIGIKRPHHDFCSKTVDDPIDPRIDVPIRRADHSRPHPNPSRNRLFRTLNLRGNLCIGQRRQVRMGVSVTGDLVALVASSLHGRGKRIDLRAYYEERCFDTFGGEGVEEAGGE